MYKFIRVLLGVVLALGLAGAMACDSDKGGGGGAATATGYTQADLAGRWNFVIPAVPVKGYWVIDAGGNITESVARMAGNPPETWQLGKGALTVSPDGKVRGDFALRANFSPPAGSYTLRIRGFRLRFVSASKVDGAYANALANYPGGVFAGRVTGPTYNITLEKK